MLNQFLYVESIPVCKVVWGMGPSSPLPIPFSRKQPKYRLLAMRKAFLSVRERSPALFFHCLTLENSLAKRKKRTTPLRPSPGRRIPSCLLNSRMCSTIRSWASRISLLCCTRPCLSTSFQPDLILINIFGRNFQGEGGEVSLEAYKSCYMQPGSFVEGANRTTKQTIKSNLNHAEKRLFFRYKK